MDPSICARPDQGLILRILKCHANERLLEMIKKTNKLTRASPLEKGEKNVTKLVVVSGDREGTKVGDR